MFTPVIFDFICISVAGGGAKSLCFLNRNFIDFRELHDFHHEIYMSWERVSYLPSFVPHTMRYDFILRVKVH